MEQIITFDKSLQTRLQEYDEVFSGLETLPYPKIQNEWGYYLELTIDPSGWQAVWKIPRIKCESLKVPFPTVVLVYISNINFPELTALVKILAVQDDISLPEKHYVPLTQLWPTKEQDKTIALNMNSTANILDMLRFFYLHLLMPWDEDDESSDWRALHLESRLRLYYDLKNGKIPKHTTEHIFFLLNEARRLNNKRKALLADCDDMDSDIEQEVMFSDKNMETLIEINVRLIEIQNEINLLENEMFRKVILKRQDLSREKVIKESSGKSSVWLVFKEGKPNEYITFLQNVEILYPNQDVIFATDFMEKVETANLNDMLLLNESKHFVRTHGAIIEDFTIRGIGNKEKIKIISEAEEVMFDCVAENANFENLTLNSKSTHCAILVRKGKVTFKNCNIFGNKCATTLQGVLVLSGAELVLENCEIEGFYVGIVGNSRSKITVENCKVSRAHIGLKVYDECKLKFNDTNIKDCQQYGFLFETEQDHSMAERYGNMNVLNKIPSFDIQNSTATHNGKCDFVVIHSKIKAMDNLFTNPDVDPTIMESDDDDMETSVEAGNNTVIEIST